MWEQILNFLSNEWLGIIASIFLFVGFVFSKELLTRIINMIGCALFVAQGIVSQVWTVVFSNAAIIVLHVVKLIQMYVANRKQANSDEAVGERAEDTNEYDEHTNELPKQE